MKQNCPLCDREADCKEVDYNNSIKYFCPVCQKFVISNDAAKFVKTLSNEEKNMLAKEVASAPDGKILRIFQPHAGSNKPLGTEYVIEANWR